MTASDPVLELGRSVAGGTQGVQEWVERVRVIECLWPRLCSSVQLGSARVQKVDWRRLHDPQHDPSIRGHIGRNLEIIRGLRSPSGLISIGEANEILHPPCKSGRRRSVACGTMLAYLRHLIVWHQDGGVAPPHATQWSGGRCPARRLVPGVQDPDPS